MINYVTDLIDNNDIMEQSGIPLVNVIWHVY